MARVRLPAWIVRHRATCRECKVEWEIHTNDEDFDPARFVCTDCTAERKADVAKRERGEQLSLV